MRCDLVLRNGRVVVPGDVIEDGGVAISDGRVVHVGTSSTMPKADTTIDLEGRIAFPGLFDPHTHFGGGDALGHESMIEDFRRATRDCLVGGVTTIATTTVIADRSLPELVTDAIAAGTTNSWCDFRITAPVSTRKQVEQIAAAAALSVVSFKFFPGYVGEQAEGFGMDPAGCTPDFFYEACEAIAKVGDPAFAMIHAEEPHVRRLLGDRMQIAQRSDDLVAWAEATPSWAESVQIFQYGCVARDLGVPLYVVHLSAAHSVETIEALQAKGWDLIGETLTSFLTMTATDVQGRGLGAHAKVQPPIRFEEDLERLWSGVLGGSITIVGTDSINYSSGFKCHDTFWHARAGLNLQMADTLPLLFDAAVHRRGMALPDLAKLLSENAARRYGMFPRKGAITPGSDGDIVVIDPLQEVQLGVERYRSGADFSIYEGRRVRGAPVMTFLRGELVMADGEIVAAQPSGRYATEMP
jgi:dihydropyrimidinase/dihydroorotase